MEVDGSANGGGGCGGAGCVSGEMEKKSMVEVEPKVKRKMKTPSQLETLEKTYAVESYPSESLRAELSVKLGLSDRQLQMWFCHRRLKDKKLPTEKKQKKSLSPSPAEGPSAGSACQMAADNADVVKERGPMRTLFGGVDTQQRQLQRVVHKVGTALPRISSEVPSMRRFYEPPLAISEQRAIAFVEAQLGEPLREDGPILGMEFDPLPPGAFGEPIDQQHPAGLSYDSHLLERPDNKPNKGPSRALHEYQFLPEKPVRNDTFEKAAPPHIYGSPNDALNTRVPLPTGRSVMQSNEKVTSGYGVQSQITSLLSQRGRQGHHLSSASGEVDVAAQVTPLVNVDMNAHYYVPPVNGLNNQIITDKQILHDQERLERKRKSLEARIAKEVEAHEKRIRKELEKQDILRRKREEQIRKEMEKQDRERRKEEERLLREKQREEERFQREQRREMERREKFLRKEYIKAEKIRLKEEMRKEKVAAKLKAANDKAAARRIAKGSMELIEDEQLELMELAALSKGLSVLALDSETLQNLDLFKDKLSEFPPKTVDLKRPFGFHPWNDSEEDVGNLLMVWRFLITFADVLGLWPFTLDEFTQALHDCDPRLLGEIHIAILRSIIKDIEDVARTPTTAVLPNQNSVLITGGGHPQIVDGAYAWGFNLVSWKWLLTPLTWPEVLRQMALSAGFGPKLKQNVQPPSFHDELEAQGDDGETVISNLRSGAAAENAVAVMQERGNPRRSRHRLTPGTVKFAAFHVLSLEGEKGLSIVDVAHKIQNSGLRDLTTSKTPEASISAALSRDTKLFKRTAPSTYCVRSPYRKNSIDTDAVLAAAREKIRLYQNSNVDGETEEVEKDDAERDPDSESDTADDPDADDLDAISKLKEDSCSEMRIEDTSCSMFVKGNSCIEYLKTPLDVPETQNSSLKLPSGETCNGKSGNQYMNLTGIHSQVDFSDQEDNVIDGCGFGEPWVEALTEREYADLSIEERLNALVTLINIVNEGNTMRIALEERLEAANALKKQMWAEAQLDKRRMKEENILKLPNYSSVVGNRAEHHPPFGTTEDKQSPLSGDIKNMLPSANYTFQLVDLNEQQNDQSNCNDIIGKNSLMHEASVGSDNLLLHQSMYGVDKSRSELKALIGHLAEDMYVYRSLPLGLDRKRNRYWQFITSPSRNDPANGRIYVELHNGFWRLIDSEEGFDALMSCLDIRGIREYHLHSMLKRIEISFREAVKENLSCSFRDEHARNQVNKGIVGRRPMLDTCFSEDNHSNIPLSYLIPPYSSVPFSCELKKNVIEETELIDRYKDVEMWMQEECVGSSRLNAFNSGKLRCKPLLEICKSCHDLFTCDDNHCQSCHVTYSASEKMLNFPEHVTQCNRKLSEEPGRVIVNLSLSPRVRLLKAILATIEASIPSEALASVWSDEYRGSWGIKLQRASSAEELLQILAMVENSIKRDFLSGNYKTTSEILNSSNVIADSSGSEAIAVLPWIPKTTSAVALRLMELDSSIYHTLHQKESKQKDNEAGHLTMLPSRSNVLGSMIDNDSQVGYQQQNNWVDFASAHGTMKRGRGRPRGPTRTRGGKSMCPGATGKNKFQEFPGWKGRPRGQGGHSKSHRSIRRQQKATKGLVKTVEQRASSFDDTQELQQEEWNLEETQMDVAGDENGSSSERPESSGGTSQASADEYNDVLVDYSAVRNGNSGHSTGCGRYNEGRDDDGEDGVMNEHNDEDEADDAEVELERDIYDDGFYKSDFSEEGNQSTGVEEQQVRNMDGGGLGSSSSADYSY